MNIELKDLKKFILQVNEIFLSIDYQDLINQAEKILLKK